jgi:hypothetical protein
MRVPASTVLSTVLSTVPRFVLCLLGTACVTPTEQPLPSVGEFSSDPALLKIWEAEGHLAYRSTLGTLSPDGLFTDDSGTWAWSTTQPRLVRWTPKGTQERPAPANTRRCGPGWCIGEREIWWGQLRIPGWWRDGLVQGDHLYALTRDALVAFDATGLEQARVPVPTAYRLGAMGNALWVLGGDPELFVVGLDAQGLPETPREIQRTAPLRDAAWDGKKLWTVGPLDTQVRRKGGPVRDLRTEVTALDGTALRQGRLQVVARYDWEAVIDGTRIAAIPGFVAASATGSGQVWTLDLDRVVVHDTCATPTGIALFGPNDWQVTCRLDDALGTPSGAHSLDPTPRDTLVDAGERLFYEVGLWPETTFTCNSCHWDGSTDHRLQPGFEEKRWELTRPVAGTGVLAPIFSPGQSPDLPHAVEGLVRVLDPRAWSDPDGQWWFEPRTISTKSGIRTLGAFEVREALLSWILVQGIEPAMADSVDPQDLALFVDECTPCHQPVKELRTRTQHPPETRPLVWAAPLFAKVGPPAFTAKGNRVSPLTNLARGGPYLTDGSAATLEDVVRAKGDYSPAQVQALVRALLSL